MKRHANTSTNTYNGIRSLLLILTLVISTFGPGLMPARAEPAGFGLQFDGTKAYMTFGPNLNTTPKFTSIQHAGLAGGIGSAGQFRKIKTLQTGLIRSWGLDEGSGSAKTDSPGNVNAGTITGTSYRWIPRPLFNATVDLPPDSPQLVSPANNATNVPTPATLSVNVSDPEYAPLDVTFYGRPLQAAAGPDFTIVIIPDAQYYASTYPAIYNAQMQWIADNKTSNNIVYVASLGDNVSSASNLTQWANADTAYDILDAANVPYGLAAGNRDGAPSGTGNFNTNFGVTRYTGKPYYGGHYGSDNDNHYALFESSGQKYIVIFIEYDDAMTATDNPVLQWASGLLVTHSDRRAIVISHYMLQGGTSPSLSTQGQTIYNALKGNSNLFLMMGGHLDVAARRTDTFNGNTVYTLRSAYQGVDSQQSGYLRIMRFSPTDDLIYVRTYSPTQNKDYDKADADQNNFTLAYAMDGTGFETIGTATGVASGGTASISWAGLDPGKPYEWFVVTSDGTQQTSSATWNFTTAGGTNQPPVITEIDPLGITMSEDGAPSAFNVTLHATDPEDETLSWSIFTPASHGAVSASGTGTSKVIDYVPNANYNSNDTFVVQVSDGNGGIDRITVNVTIQPVNDPPLCGSATLVTIEDTTGEASPSCTDVDTGDTLTYSIVAQGTKGTASVVAGKLSYTPNTNANGPDSFSYKANDGTDDSNTETVSISITPVNDAPVCQDLSLTTAEDTAGKIAALCTDVDNISLTYSLTQPVHGSAAGPGASFSYTPAANYNGSDIFTYKASDGKLVSAPANVAVMVTPVNDAPLVTQPADQSNAEGATISLQIVATDLDGNPLAYSASGLPGGLSIDPANGLITGTLPYSAAGSYDVTVTASDGSLQASRSFRWTVSGTNRAPLVTQPADQSNAEGATISLQIVATDPDGNPLAYSASGLPGGLSIDPASGLIAGTLPYSAAGSYDVTVTASDGSLQGSRSFRWTVSGTNRAPLVTQPADQSNAEGATISLQIVATDPDGNPLAYSASGLPGGLSIDPANGLITGTLPYSAAGSYDVTVTVSDGSLQASRSFRWTVINLNWLPLVVNDSYTAGTALTIAAPAVLADAGGDPLTAVLVSRP